MATYGGKVLVTGASGYIATHVVKQLLEVGYKVRGTVRSLKNEKKVQPVRDLCPEAKDSLELVEADLMNDDSWKPTVQGCDYVIHVASPNPGPNPMTEEEVIRPAVEGTQSVLRACKAAGTVKRVVLTSSVVAVAYSAPNGKICSEQDWTDGDDVANGAYIRSKVKAERAAWKFIEELGEGEKFELAVVNPGFVMGPVLCGTMMASMEIPKQLIQREMPMLARIKFSVCDVRDVAAAHLKAMTIPEAAGHRHLIANGSLWLHEIAGIIDREFRPQGYKIPSIIAPKLLLRVVGLFDQTARAMLPMVDKDILVDNARLVNVLGINPFPLEQTVLDMCYDMIESGYIRKTPQYKPRTTAAKL